MQKNEILNKKRLNENIVSMDVYVPEVARKVKPGQFIILRVNEKGERIPLTVNNWDPEKGTITLIVQEVGKTTKKLGGMSKGAVLCDLVGPLGKPAELKKFGKVVCVGGGVGTAVIYPEVVALRKLGNQIISIIGARTRDLLILEEEMKEWSHQLYITTDDGSYGRKGVVTDALKEILEKEKVDLVIAIGPVIMMRYVSLMTQKYEVKTIVSLNPIMVDGTGMCGSCRVTVGGESKFVCVDGPEFDGHQVDFVELMERNKRFLEEEKRALEYEED